jgi:hypothetical protein
MNIYTVTAIIPTEDEDTQVEMLLYVDAANIQEAQDIAKGVAEVTLDKIISASLLTDKVWKRSDLRKDKGQA